MAQSLLVKPLNGENYTFRVQIPFQRPDTTEKILTKRKKSDEEKLYRDRIYMHLKS